MPLAEADGSYSGKDPFQLSTRAISNRRAENEKFFIGDLEQEYTDRT